MANISAGSTRNLQGGSVDLLPMVDPPSRWSTRKRRTEALADNGRADPDGRPVRARKSVGPDGLLERSDLRPSTRISLGASTWKPSSLSSGVRATTPSPDPMLRGVLMYR